MYYAIPGHAILHAKREASMKVRKILKWIGISLGSLLGIALIAVGVIYFIIGNDFERTFEIGLTHIDIPTDEASITEGQRLAQLRGCFSGCHGDETEGAVFFDVPDGTKVVAPDLGLAVEKYSIPELERIIRHGVRPDGTSVLVPMPSQMLSHLSDREFSLIVAFLQTMSPGAESFPDSSYGPLARVMFTFFKQDLGTILAADLIDHDRKPLATRPDDLLGLGEYLALTTCSECHGDDLQGSTEFTPPLAVVVAYSIEDFTTLMKTGVPIGDRELELMAKVALRRFHLFTDHELKALHTYLRTLASN
jgi:mono/diheme cytochrome c family protein